MKLISVVNNLAADGGGDLVVFMWKALTLQFLLFLIRERHRKGGQELARSAGVKCFEVLLELKKPDRTKHGWILAVFERKDLDDKLARHETRHSVRIGGTRRV